MEHTNSKQSRPTYTTTCRWPDFQRRVLLPQNILVLALVVLGTCTYPNHRTAFFRLAIVYNTQARSSNAKPFQQSPHCFLGFSSSKEYVRQHTCWYHRALEGTMSLSHRIDVLWDTHIKHLFTYRLCTPTIAGLSSHNSLLHPSLPPCSKIRRHTRYYYTHGYVIIGTRS